jgi:predicted RNA-binding protein
MCEFKVLLNGERIMEDVLYAKAEDGMVTLRDVLGSVKIIECAEIIEVNVISTQLILKRDSSP